MTRENAESAKRNQQKNPFTSLPWVMAVMSMPWVIGVAFLKAVGLQEPLAVGWMTMVVIPFIYWGTRDIEP